MAFGVLWIVTRRNIDQIHLGRFVQVLINSKKCNQYKIDANQTKK
jgi:hypothetical protein